MDEPSTIRSSESKKEICEFIPINGVPVATFGDRKSSKRFSIIEDLMNQTDTPEILSETVEKYINSESTIKTKKSRFKRRKSYTNFI
jgi:macrodomain Ter protein organizer (MatP/YcbG family)